MRCTNCYGELFIRTEYTMPGLRAPAIECAHCHVLHLDETAIRSEEDRESVRLAVAARASACVKIEGETTDADEGNEAVA